MKKTISIILCLLFIFVFSACNGSENEPTGETEATTSYEDLPIEVRNSTVTANGAYELYNGVYIISIDPYSGKYVEDGSDDELKNIISVTLMNTTDTSYQMLDFSVDFPQGTYNFSAKSVFANSKITVLEKNRCFMPPQTKEFTAAVTDIIHFNEKPSVHLDEFEISYSESIINVKNKTDADIDNIYVYYKSVTGDTFFGGITYRVNFGTVPAGETVQKFVERFKPNEMKIVFVTYEK